MGVKTPGKEAEAMIGFMSWPLLNIFKVPSIIFAAVMNNGFFKTSKSSSGK